MSDYKKPRTNLNNFLPEQLRSALLKNLNENLFNRFLTKDEHEHIVGILGDAEVSSPLSTIKEKIPERQGAQLQPVVNAKIGTENVYLSFQDFLQRLSRMGVNVDDYDNWGGALQFNLVPPLDIDKLINYRNYYWSSSDNTETPDYITIKNQKNWALARSAEFKKMITSVQQSFTVVVTDQTHGYMNGNQLSTFAQGDQVLLSNGAKFYINTISSITLNPVNGRTMITFMDTVADTSVSSIYSFLVPVASISTDLNQFTFNGDWSNVFITDYVFLAPKQGLNQNTLFKVKSSNVDTSSGKTYVTVDQAIPLNAAWSKVSMLPMVSLADEEYNSLSGTNSIQYNTTWNNGFLGDIIWARDLTVLESNEGYTQLGDHGIRDDSIDFVSSLIRPGDHLVINNSANTDKYRIISVEQHFLGIDSSVRMFTKESINYTIERETIYDYLIKDSAPTTPSLYDYWVDSINDLLKQWNGSSWTTVVKNISLLVDATHQRYKLSLEQKDPWSLSNKWVHKNQITSYSGKIRAQLPIIEFDPYLELSYTSLATYEWKYRKDLNDIYYDVDAQPTLLEVSDIRIESGNEFYFINDNTIVLNEKYGNLSDEIKKAGTLKLVGFTKNSGLHEVLACTYKQSGPTSRFSTYIVLKNKVVDPFDLPKNATIGPEYTSNGDVWLGYDAHWIFYGLKDISASSLGPDINPALNVFVKTVTTDDYESNVGLAWQSFSFLNDGMVGPTIPLDTSLHDLVLYDDYQEGDLRVYINGIRQYGNFQDVQSTINPDFIGSIVFDSSVEVNSNDIIRVELGEYALQDVGKRALKIKTNRNLVDPSIDYDLVNWTSIRKLEQDKPSKNVYPFFTVYDIHGNPKDIASRIFTFSEDSSYALNKYLLKRIVFNSDTQDYQFNQEASDSETGELYSYKNFSQPNNPLQTIWKRGLNNEQYKPTKLQDGSWEIPNTWFFNINHELRPQIKFSDLYQHFSTIIASQEVPGVIKSSATNQFYIDDNVNYGLGGTIKEHNGGMDILVSSTLVNNVTPIDLIRFAHDRYIGALSFIQEDFINEITDFILDTSFVSMEELADSLTNTIINNYETNSKFDLWFGDSTTFNPATNSGIKNWIATLPYLNLADKHTPYINIDTDFNMYEVVCHDGHRQKVDIQPSLIQKLNNTLIASGAMKQIITDDTQPLPETNTNGALVVRYNTKTNHISTFRYASGKWEKFNYHELLANIVFDIESKLYQNCTETELVYDFTNLVNYTDYSNQLNTQFSNYNKANNISTPLLNTGYKQNDPFSWNYEFTPIPSHPVTGNVSYDTSADFRSLYNKLYGTPHPHREPWRLQGFTDKPVWWDSYYKDTTGTRTWNSLMWSNICSGIVPTGLVMASGSISTGMVNQVVSFAYIPVNMESTDTIDGYKPDSLLPPYWNSSNTTNSKIKTPYDAGSIEIVSPNLDYTFGDGSPNEWLWENSLQRLYDNLTMAFRLDPLSFMNKSFNGNKQVKVNCLDVDIVTKKVFSHSNTLFHGDIVNDEVFLSNGLNQWYVNYNRYFGYDGDASQFKSLWKEWKTNLSYLFGSFINKDSFSISNTIFDITQKDFEVNVKKTVGYSDIWMDSVRATILSVPSKYSALRDNGIGWTVQFDTSSVTNQNISYYPKENFDFRTVKNSNLFEVFAYDMAGAGIVDPVNSIRINYNQKLSYETLVNYKKTKNYSARITINNVVYSISLTGKTTTDVSDVIAQINDSISNAKAFLESGNITIQSEYNISIEDNGLFATLSNNFSGIDDIESGSYSFEKYFDISGNLTNILLEGSKFTIEDSTQFNGTYTIKSVYYDISNSLTKIFVNEDVELVGNTVDGIIRPLDRRTLPDTWETGTEVYLSSTGSLPSPLNEFRAYKLIRVSDYTFQLSLTDEGFPISTLTTSNAQQYVGRVKHTFKANSGKVTNYSWRQHYSDTRQTVSYAQPIYISGIQQIIDFIDGYSDYMETLGFSPVTSDIVNEDNGLQITWQTEIENFIDNLYIARATKQTEPLEFKASVDLENSRFLFNESNVNIASAVLERVSFSVYGDGALPDPISNPLKQHISYYAVPSSDGLGFQIAYTQSDAIKGNFIKLENIGSGDIRFHIVTAESDYAQYWLTPYKNAVRINHPLGLLSNVTHNDRMDILTNQRIYDFDGSAIPSKNLFVLRNDDYSQIFLTDETKRDNVNAAYPISIAGLHAFIDTYEHILVFNDRTITDDLIYDTFIGIRTPRFYVEFDRNTSITLRPNVGGYFLHNDNLVQNFESAIDDLRYLNDSYNALESKEIVKQLRRSMGYSGQQSFMKNLGINSKSDYLFWRGMIRNKGTNFAIKAYTNQQIFDNADLDEFWAYKLAEFGDSKEKTYVEMKLKREDSIGREARFEFVNPEESVSDLSFSGISINDKTRWWNQPDVVQSLSPYLSFYFSASVSSVEYDKQNDIQLINDNYILETRPCDGVVITYFDSAANKTKTMVEGADYTKLNRSLIKFTLPYDPTSLTQISISTINYNYNAHNPASLIDKKSGTLLKNIAIWNPTEHQHYQPSFAAIDLVASSDPALYTEDFTGSKHTNAWASNNENRIWLDDSRMFYIPYNDRNIFSNINDRIDNWGRLADNGKVKVYQWVKSDVLPSGYETEYPNDGIPYVALYKNNGTKEAPIWNKVTYGYESYFVAKIAQDTASSLTGKVSVYVNGKFDYTLDLDTNTLYDYAYGSFLSGQINKPSLNDIIVIEPVEYIPTDDDIKNLVYKYDTPYSIETYVNSTDGSEVVYYYYWINGKTTKLNSVTNYTTNCMMVEQNLINNPDAYMIPLNLRFKDDGYGVNFGSVFDGTAYGLPLRYVQLVIKGLNGVVVEEDRFALRLLRDFTLRDRLPHNGDIYDFAENNKITTPLALKNRHTEWKLFREKQSQKVDIYLWEKLISAMVGYKVTNGIIDSNSKVPSLERVLFDQLYDAGSRYGLGEGQIFVEPSVGINTVQSILNDPSQVFTNVDIASFLTSYNFNSPNDIVNTMYAIYEGFDPNNVNNIYFSVLSDAMAFKKQSPDFFKTSWIALDISQNVNTASEIYSINNGNIVPGGLCDIDGNIVVPTQPPLPSPSPTPSVSPSITPTASVTITPSVTASVSISSSVTPTPTSTATPSFTPTFTPTGTPSPTNTTTPTFTPTVTGTATVTPSVTASPSITATPTFTPTPSPVGNSCYDNIVLAASPLFYYKLDDLNGVSVADFTGNGRDAEIDGDVVLGNDGLFTTSVRRIDFPYDFSQNNFLFTPYGEYMNMPYDFTFEIHANADAAQQGAIQPSIVQLIYDTATMKPQFQLYVDMDTGKYAFQISTTDMSRATLLSNTLADGTPHVITCRRMNDRLYMFIDGREEVSMDVSGANLMTNANGISIGGGPYRSGSEFNYIGGVDCFSIYNYALDNDNIKSRFECISGFPITPTPTPTPTPTISISNTPTVTPSVTASVTFTPTNTVTPSVTGTATVTPTISTTPSASRTPSVSTTPAPTHTKTPTPTPSSSNQVAYAWHNTGTSFNGSPCGGQSDPECSGTSVSATYPCNASTVGQVVNCYDCDGTNNETQYTWECQIV